MRCEARLYHLIQRAFKLTGMPTGRTRLVTMSRMALFATLLAATAARAEVCLDHPYSAKGDPLAADMAAVRHALTPFPGLLDALDTARPRICATDTPSVALGTFGADQNEITVDAALPASKRVAVLIHEIRHLEQSLRGICPAATLTMRDNARAMFALEADAMAVAHLVAWSSLEKGEPSIFDALKSARETGDIAQAFEAEIRKTNDPAAATAAAFDAWYGSDSRRERYYVSTCMAYLDRQESEGSFAGTAPLSADFLSHICSLPDRTSYPCVEPDRPIPR